LDEEEDRGPEAALFSFAGKPCLPFRKPPCFSGLEVKERKALFLFLKAAEITRLNRHRYGFTPPYSALLLADKNLHELDT
jgi:hypothetical protein